jgi:hypothetical protein
MIRVAMCRAECGDCGKQFPYPFLGDFAYGGFILRRADGFSFCFLSAFDNPAWDFVSAHVQKKGHVQEWGPVLHEVIARLADKVDGHSLTTQGLCPHCGSHCFRDWGQERISWAEIQEVTFRSFTALDEQSKEALVHRLELEVVAEHH